MIEKHVDDWKPKINRVIESKVTEFKLLGYGDVSADRVWNCLLSKVWRKNKVMKLHEVVEDVLHLSGHQYMTFIAMETYQSDDLMASIAAVTER